VIRNCVAFLIILIVVTFQACVPSKPTVEEKELPADRLIKKLEANRRKIKTFEGTGIINVESSQLSAKANFEVALIKPDTIKLSVFGPFGIDLAHALVTKDDFKFYDVMRNDLYTGNVRMEILKNIFKVDLTFDDLLDAFSGSVNLTPNLRRTPDVFSADGKSYTLNYFDGQSNKHSIYEISVNEFAITNYKLMKDSSDVIFEGNYSDFKKFENVPVPFYSKVEYKEKGQAVTIEYRNIQVNKDITNLSIDYPNDVNVIKW
jgi:outer membrane lipoprotein-sorting protein